MVFSSFLLLTAARKDPLTELYQMSILVSPVIPPQEKLTAIDLAVTCRTVHFFNSTLEEDFPCPTRNQRIRIQETTARRNAEDGLFLNAHSPTVAEQLAHSGYDWLLVDTQHGPMGYEKLSAMLSGIANGGAKSLVRVGGYADRPESNRPWTWAPTAFLFPNINTAAEAREAISCAKYPTVARAPSTSPSAVRTRADYWATPATGITKVSSHCKSKPPPASRTLPRSRLCPASTFFFSGRTISACRWASTTSTNSPHVHFTRTRRCH